MPDPEARMQSGREQGESSELQRREASQIAATIPGETATIPGETA